MAEITAALVKDMRERSGAGMMDCKKALVENGGDMEAAIDWLRKKGLSAAAKKSGRVAAEGLVGVISAANRGAMVEVNAETDFVARNETFQAFVAEVARVALAVGEDIEAIKAAPFPGTGRTVGEELTHMVATIGENMNIRRAKVFAVEQGAVATYVHSAVKPGLGKIGVLAALEGAGEVAVLETLGRQVGMHVAAARPEALDTNAVDPAALEREKLVLTEQMRANRRKPLRVCQSIRSVWRWQGPSLRDRQLAGLATAHRHKQVDTVLSALVQIRSRNAELAASFSAAFSYFGYFSIFAASESYQ